MNTIYKTIDTQTGKTLKVEVPRDALGAFCEQLADGFLLVEGQLHGIHTRGDAIEQIKKDIFAGTATYEGGRVVVI